MGARHGRIALLALLAAGCAGCGEVVSQQAARDHYVRGQLLADKGNLDGALKELELAVKNDPSLSAAHAAAGDIHRRRGNYQLARHSYERACDTNRYAFRPHYNLGVTYQLLAEAATTFGDIQSLLQKAVFVYLRAAELDRRDFDTYLNTSACYYQLGKYDLAEQYCKLATMVNTNSPQAWCNLGTIYDSQNRLYDAIRAYKISLELDVHQPILLLNLGATYHRQGRIKAALRTYEVAAAEDPKSSLPHQQMGMCYFQLREFDKALEAYGKAIELDPKNADAHRGIGAVYMSQYVLDRSKLALRDKGLAAWQRSLEITPDQKRLRRLIEKYSPEDQDLKLLGG